MPLQNQLPPKKSIEELKAAAEGGDTEAQSALGLLYELGLEVKPNPKEAAKFWGMAAKTGDALAQFSLANIITTQFEDSDENRAMAQALYKKAEISGMVREDKALRLLEKDKGRSLRVLVVDDTEAARTPLRRYIEAEGCDVVEASDGVQALTILKKDPAFELIITDISMPHMGGLEMLKSIRAIPNLKNIPVVVCSSENSDDYVLRAKNIGIQGWIVKPAKPHVLRRYLLKYT